MKENQHKRLARLKRMERIFKPISLVLGFASAAGVYWQSTSFWLALFVLFQVFRFVSNCIPRIVYYDRSLHYALFYSTWPVFGSIIIYLTYQRWQIMWLAVILGTVGGFYLPLPLDFIFFREMATDHGETKNKVVDFIILEVLKTNPEAAAMKQRFTANEWEQIRTVPQKILGALNFFQYAHSESEKELVEGFRFVAEALEKAADGEREHWEYEDPLLKMMFIDWYAGCVQLHLEMSPVADFTTTFLANFSSKDLYNVLDGQYQKIAKKGKLDEVGTDALALKGFTDIEKGLQILKARLNHDELRSFFGGLSSLAFSLIFIAGDESAKMEQLDLYLKLIPFENEADVIGMLNVKGS